MNRTVLQRVVATTLVAGLVGVCIWMLLDHLYPIPGKYTGVWVNEQKIWDAEPGRVKLILRRNGTGNINIPPKYFFFLEDFTYRVDGDALVLHTDAPERSIRLTVIVDENRLTLKGSEEIKGELAPGLTEFRFNRAK